MSNEQKLPKLDLDWGQARPATPVNIGVNVDFLGVATPSVSEPVKGPRPPLGTGPATVSTSDGDYTLEAWLKGAPPSYTNAAEPAQETSSETDRVLNKATILYIEGRLSSIMQQFENSLIKHFDDVRRRFESINFGEVKQGESIVITQEIMQRLYRAEETLVELDDVMLDLVNRLETCEAQAETKNLNRRIGEVAESVGQLQKAELGSNKAIVELNKQVENSVNYTRTVHQHLMRFSKEFVSKEDFEAHKSAACSIAPLQVPISEVEYMAEIQRLCVANSELREKVDRLTLIVPTLEREVRSLSGRFQNLVELEAVTKLIGEHGKAAINMKKRVVGLDS